MRRLAAEGRLDPRDDGLDRRSGRLEDGRRDRPGPASGQPCRRRRRSPDAPCRTGGTPLALRPMRRATALCAGSDQPDLRPLRPCAGHRRPRRPAARARALQELDLAKGLRDDLASGDMVEVRTTSCPNCGAQVEITGRHPCHRMPVLRHAGGAGHRHPAPHQAAGAGALRADRSRGAQGDDRLDGQPVVRARHPAGIRPQGPGDERGLCPVLDLRCRHRQPLQRRAGRVLLRDANRDGPGQRPDARQRQEQVRHTRWYPASGRRRARFRRCAGHGLAQPAAAAGR